MGKKDTSKTLLDSSTIDSGMASGARVVKLTASVKCNKRTSSAPQHLIVQLHRCGVGLLTALGLRTDHTGVHTL